MPDPIQPPPVSVPTQPQPAKKGRGCFFWGCLSCIVLFLVVCVAVFAVVQFVKSQVNAYTDSAPMKLPKVEMADAEYKELKDRVKLFTDALDQNKPAPPLTLTEREINALILKSGKKEFQDKVYVSLNGDQVKGQISIPLPEMPFVPKGRYLNGEATFKVSLKDGVLKVEPQDVVVKGKSLPESVMGKLRQENLAKDAAQDPETADKIGKFDSIIVQDSRVTVTARTNAPTTTPTPPNN